MKTDTSPPRGTRDLLPAAVALRDSVYGTIREVYSRYGYQRVETPCLEDIQRLQGGEGGENEKLIYRVLRRGLAESLPSDTPVVALVDLGLRFDLTVPLARFYANNVATLPVPFRSLQFGPVFRAERPQKGRYRQFVQCDIDVIGEESVLAEVELIEATTDALGAVGLSGITVRLSDRRLLSALAAGAGLPEPSWPAFFVALDKLDKVGWAGVRAELADRDLPAGPVGAALDRVEQLRDAAAKGAPAGWLAELLPGSDERVVADLMTTADTLDRLAANRGISWEFDPTLVRGMGYYTGQIFEIVHPSSSGSVAGGGRYDRLIGRALGRDVPACGFSIGFERIVELLAAPSRPELVAVLVDTDVSLAEAAAAARGLREQGRKAAVVRRQGRRGAQLARLEEWGYTSAVELRAERDPTDELLERPLRSSG